MSITSKNVGVGLIVLGIVLISILSLVKINFDSQAVFLCQAVSNDPGVEMADCPAHTSNIPWLVTVGFGVAFLVLAAGIYLFVASRGVVQKREVSVVDTKHFSEEEKQIVSILAERGSMYQSDLIKETGFSKVKITRLLDKLEHDDRILERKRRGMANIVVLK